MTQIPTWNSGSINPVSGRTAPGTTIGGRYELRAAVGHGGMGTVWRAADTLLRRDVAVKEVVLPPGLAPTDRDAMYERTLREARAAAALQHPAVVQVYDVVHESSRPWIVMELLDARSLADMVIEDGPLAPRAVAKIGVALLGALEVAHAIGVLHRDVKPANVLICVDGRCVLTDFGVARMPTDVQLTTPGMVLGSPHFISPERAMGLSFGPPSDLFSLGVTLYTAVEGRPPFDKGDPIETMHAVVEDPPAPPVRSGPLVPVLFGLLEKDPERRLDVKSARGMLRELLSGPLASKTAGHSVTDPYAVMSSAVTTAMPAAAPATPSGQIGGRAMLAPGESLTDRLAALRNGRRRGAGAAAAGGKTAAAAGTAGAAGPGTAGTSNAAGLGAAGAAGSAAAGAGPAGAASAAGVGAAGQQGWDQPTGQAPGATDSTDRTVPVNPPGGWSGGRGPADRTMPLASANAWPTARTAGSDQTTALPGAGRVGARPGPDQTAALPGGDQTAVVSSPNGGGPGAGPPWSSSPAGPSWSSGPWAVQPKPGGSLTNGGSGLGGRAAALSATVRGWPRRTQLMAAGGVAVLLLLMIIVLWPDGDRPVSPPQAGGPATTTASTFETEQYQDRGISLNVPKGWTRTAAGVWVDYIDPQNKGRKVRILVEDFKNVSASRWAEVAEGNLKKPTSKSCPKPYSRVDLSQVELAGQDAAQLEYTCGDGDGKRHGIWRGMARNDKIYSFYLTTTDTTFDESKPIFDEMVRSFELVNS